jgi:hypothetical protein
VKRPPMRPSHTRPHEPSDRDPTRDAALGAALRRRDAIVSDTDTLRRAIAANARERLARLEAGEAAGDQWWDWTARWARAAIPIACAAGLGGVAVTAMLALPGAEEQPPLRAPVVAFATVASPDANATQLIDSLVGPATHDWVLNGAVSR